MVTEGSWIVSAGKTCFCPTRAALLIVLNVQSTLTSAHGNGSSEREMISGDDGSLPPGPCGQIYSCQPVEHRCLSCLQKSSLGYLKTTSVASSAAFCQVTGPLVSRLQFGLT